MEKYPFIKCLDPQVVKNKSTQDLILVPCGKCASCLNHKGLINTTKCKLESLSHKYCIFCTLTYNNKHVPTAKIVKYYGKSILVHDDGEILSESEYNEEYIRMLEGKCDQLGRIMVLQKRDVQLFLKRLRKKLNEKIRYYICGEYGTVHFRPHYHLLLFCNEGETVQAIHKNLHSSWRLGYTDSFLSKGKSIEYTAKYLNSFSNLPQILRNGKSIRPFSLHSVHLGEEILRRSKEEVEKMQPTDFINVSVCFDNGIKNVPMWSSLASYYFPKCRGFSTLNNEQRYTLYLLNKSVQQWSGLSKPAEQARYIIDDLIMCKENHYSDYYSYLPDCVKTIISICNFNVYNLEAEIDRIYTSIYNLLRTSYHFINNVASDGRYYHYIQRIDNFYNELNRVKLIENLSLQVEYSEEYNCTSEEDFYAFYPDKYKYGNLKKQPIYKDYYNFNHKISRDNVKHKHQNDLNGIFNK